MPYIKNVAIVGASGNIGSVIVDALLKQGKHTVTAITREDSKSAMPEGVKVVRVNYDDATSLAAGLNGQDALIITMSVFAPQGQQSKLIQAAADANVPWVLPNEFTFDNDQVQFGQECLMGPGILAARKQVEDLGKSSWLGVTSSFWYEFSLGGGPTRFGFDVAQRSVTFFDDGNTPINTTTWPQSGLAIARLLALKEKPDSPEDQSVTLSTYRNKSIHISSFCVSQNDMLESVLRVTGTKREDWKISFEPSIERYQNGMQMLQTGNMMGFNVALYTRTFYQDGAGAYEKYRPLDNDTLGLPKEDLDEATKKGVEMASSFKY